MNRLATLATAVALGAGASVGIAACGGSDTTSTEIVTQPAPGDTSAQPTTTTEPTTTTTSSTTTTSTDTTGTNGTGGTGY